MSKLLHVFFDTDFRCRHAGLAARAKKESKFDIDDLGPGDMLVFINAARDRVMVLAGLDEDDSHGVLGYYRSPHGRIDLEAIQYIPDAFAGGNLRFESALKKSLIERLSKPRSKPKKKSVPRGTKNKIISPTQGAPDAN